MELDPRGVRFGATVGSVVFVVVLATGWGWLALAQAVVFVMGALNPAKGPYSYVYRALLLPRLGLPVEWEPAEPVRFAQTLGFVFAAVAGVGMFTGVTTLGVVFAAFGLLASFLNAAFGLCLGCEAYLLIRRLTAARNA
jgi:hypothetical protein